MIFRPTFTLSLILVTLAAAFLRLGLWQLDRQAEKEALFERFAEAPSLPLEVALDEPAPFARVEGRGRFDPSRHVLLDNRVWKGRAGVHVLTPFRMDTGRVVLVNRGWLPLPPDRRSLPAVPTDDAPRTLRGRLVSAPQVGQRLGEADKLAPDRWPQLVTYLDLPVVASALGEPLEPWVIQLDAGEDGGFEDRQWAAAAMRPETHGAYAVQWLALAATALVIWLVLGVRRGQALSKRATYPKNEGTEP